MGILMCFIIFQLTALITTECTLELIIKVSSVTLVGSMYVMWYNTLWLNAHNIKYLLEQFQNIYNRLNDKNETAIIEKYGTIFKYATKILTLFLTCGTIFTLLIIWLHFIKNEPHSQTVQIVIEYFVDRKKYFYLILLHISLAISIGVTAGIGGGQLLIAVAVYLCGLFRITSYRIEKAMTIRVFENTHPEKRTMIYKEIINAVKIHRQAIKYSKFISYHFKGTFLYTTLSTVICLSLNIFGMFRNALFEKKEAFVIHLALVGGLLIFMFIMNYIGQEIIDHSNDVYSRVYSSQWYTAPLHAQKLLFFMLQRSSKSVTINVAGLFVISFENFATLIKSSMSYFAVIYSIQE